MAFSIMQDIITDFIFTKELFIHSTRCNPGILYKFWEKLKSIEKITDDYNYILNHNLWEKLRGNIKEN